MTDGPRAPGDMDPELFRREGHRVVDWIADYFAHPERYPVLSRVKPGEIRAALPARSARGGASRSRRSSPTSSGSSFPGITHWNHPGFFAYFAITGSAPGVLAEFLSAALNAQGMLWRTSPSVTELEEVALGWLRRLMGLPDAFEGVIYDTASISSLHALAAAREAAVARVRTAGIAGRPDLPRYRVYCSDQAHSSIDKAVILLGLGHESLRKIPTDASSGCAPTRSRRPSRRTGRRASCRWRSWRRWARRRRRASTRCRPSRTSASANTAWLHVDCAYAGVGGDRPRVSPHPATASSGPTRWW